MAGRAGNLAAGAAAGTISFTERGGTTMSELSPTETASLSDLSEIRGPLEQEALKRLIERGEAFLPFGRTLLTSGQSLEYEVGAPADGGPARPDLVYQLLMQGMTAAARQGRLRAAGVCHATLLAQGNQPALRMVIEHANGTAFEVLMPFRKEPNGSFSLGRENVTRAKQIIFAPPEGPQQPAPAKQVPPSN
jgi:hypothetical protein